MIKIEVIGRLGADARVNDVTEERKCINFSLCENVKSKINGEKVDQAVWFECSYFCRIPTVAEYMKKGRRMYVSGSFNVEEYMSQQTGKVIRRMTITVDTLQILDFETEQAAAAPVVEEIPNAKADDKLPF